MRIRWSEWKKVTTICRPTSELHPQSDLDLPGGIGVGGLKEGGISLEVPGIGSSVDDRSAERYKGSGRRSEPVVAGTDALVIAVEDVETLRRHFQPPLRIE